MVCRLLSLIPLFIIHRQHVITSCELCQCSHKFWYSAESKTTVSGFTESHSQKYQLENDGHHHIPFEKCQKRALSIYRLYALCTCIIFFLVLWVDPSMYFWGWYDLLPTQHSKMAGTRPSSLGADMITISPGVTSKSITSPKTCLACSPTSDYSFLHLSQNLERQSQEWIGLVHLSHQKRLSSVYGCSH